jgi:hypothetical protein
MKGMVTRARVRFWLVTAGMVALGIAGSTLNYLLPWEWAQHLARDFSVALFVAGLLAFSVDTFFKTEFARDAFEASFRYVLPPELKDEVAKILRNEFIAEKHIWTVEITKVDEDVVLVTTTFERTLVNKTSLKQSRPGLYTVEDLNFPNGPSEIIECEIEDESGNIETAKPVRVPHGLEAKTGEMAVEPGHKLKVRGKATQFRRTNDIIFENWLTPTLDPRIEVIIPDDFEHQAQFGTGTAKDVEKAKYRNLYTLSGVYFPNQIMSVRWWPKGSTFMLQS